MTKKKATRSTRRPSGQSDDTDQIELDEAEERLRLAREELRQARELYSTAKKQAAESTDESPEGSIGELLDCGLGFVRKYPAVGLFAATAIGVFLGRLFRR